MSASRRRLEEEAIRLWQARRAGDAARPSAFAAGQPRTAAPAGRPAVERKASLPRSAERLDFSLMFFSAMAGEAPRADLYRLVHEAARFADARGFSAVWLPERHFHLFGGPYPNPAILAASLAGATRSIRLRAGSVVLPLHHPVDVAEAWAMVDNLSNGRVEIAFGSGWNPNDFVLSPDTFADARSVTRQRIEDVRALWRGEKLALANGRGDIVPTRIFPAPIQPELPVWVSATGSKETFAWAGRSGFDILTMLLGGDIDDIVPKIALYRSARAEAGLDPDGGRVALMLHSFVHEDGEHARSLVRAPFMEYVRSSVDVQRQGSDEGRAMTAEQREQVVAYSFERYMRSAALFGSPRECRVMLDRAAMAGVDEIACLIDFGVDERLVLESLDHLDTMRPRRPAVREGAAATVATVRTGRSGAAEPIAVVGMSARFPGASDLHAFWTNLCEGKDALSAPPPGRGGDGAPVRGGFLDDVERFDAGLFGLAPAEAEAMDPHQRVFLEQVWVALEDAGMRPGDLRGSDTGVFAAMYSTSHESLLRTRNGPLDGLELAGAVLSMVPNRTSFLFDWNGPSETINTACSSGLVAVHRAVTALRGGECGMAVVGGVSLLLAPEESAALARLGTLSPSGQCRPFDRHADGQVRGEGAGVLVLKRLADAERDDDFVHAVIRGSAVNHGGGRSQSLTLPNPTQQAACIVEAVRRSGIEPRRIGLIEAHGAGSLVGDMAELGAFERAFATLGETPQATCWVGSVKANIGALDAAGGIAGMIKAVLALRHGQIPATPNHRDALEEMDPDGPFRVPRRMTAWPDPGEGTRTAGVHAYGLGGTNAHVILEAHADRRPPAPASTGPWAIPLSAGTPEALRATAERLLAWLDSPADPPSPADLAFTLSRGRSERPYRWQADVTSVDDLKAKLRDWLATGQAPRTGAAAPAAGRRIPVPGHAFARPASVVGTFYDAVTQAEEREGDIYLTLAPLPRIVPGFSWTRTFQAPESHPEHWTMMQAAQREMRDVLFSGVDLSTATRVLDFGCGVGTDLVALARRHPATTGIGYTISARQARIAASRIAKAGLDDRLAVHHRDSARDAFPGRFDLAIGLEVAHHIADKHALFGNIASHLEDDGTLLLADCAANTVAPIELAQVGSYTSTKDDYAALLAEHGLAIVECVDLSQEVANFLHDPGLETMLADETARGHDVRLVAAVQRSWAGFGEALREGLVSYLLITARRRPGLPDIASANRRHLGLA
ncbi:MupA/Atu3671 family FMN-dependent luciferase-like monooxygenase [Marinivivus vitaminiproducens]|uniref:MupA/Atu3671 family FMN-dependent luciferase-like monooxygenase n=1 Tax=Marinivivus vitaminiproducens TaxID=3035935 RepID=UPI0027A61E24|nr:LLM class flavin-dependent oxidoreductase [Geminicoccaceae bacterium SCSIO 64248]